MKSAKSGSASDKAATMSRHVDDRTSSSDNESRRRRPKFIRKVECSVCADIANDHIHYGAIACYSCRAFFRRAVTGSTRYECSKNGSCEITKESRKSCQACRLKKCEDAGMKSSWVMTEEEKQDKKLRAMAKKTDKKATPPAAQKSDTSPTSPPSGTLQSYMARRKLYLYRKRRHDQTSDDKQTEGDRKASTGRKNDQPSRKRDRQSIDTYEYDSSLDMGEMEEFRIKQEMPDDNLDIDQKFDIDQSESYCSRASSCDENSMDELSKPIINSRIKVESANSEANSPTPMMMEDEHYEKFFNENSNMQKNKLVSISIMDETDDVRILDSLTSPQPSNGSHQPSNGLKVEISNNGSSLSPAPSSSMALSPTNSLAPSPNPASSYLHSPGAFSPFTSDSRVNSVRSSLPPSPVSMPLSNEMQLSRFSPSPSSYSQSSEYKNETLLQRMITSPGRQLTLQSNQFPRPSSQIGDPRPGSSSRGASQTQSKDIFADSPLGEGNFKSFCSDIYRPQRQSQQQSSPGNSMYRQCDRNDVYLSHRQQQQSKQQPVASQSREVSLFQSSDHNNDVLNSILLADILSDKKPQQRDRHDVYLSHRHEQPGPSQSRELSRFQSKSRVDSLNSILMAEILSDEKLRQRNRNNDIYLPRRQKMQVGLVASQSREVGLYRSNDDDDVDLNSILMSEYLSDEKPLPDLSLDASHPFDQLWAGVTSPPPPLLPNPVFPVEITMPFTIEEESELKRLIGLEQESKELIPVPNTTIMGILESMETGEPLRYDIAKEGYNTCVRRIIHFISKLTAFGAFNLEDQQAIIRTNVHMAVNIKAARLLCPANSLQKQIGLANLTSYNALNPTQTSAMQNIVLPSAKLEYHQVFSSPWCCGEDSEETFKEMMKDIFKLEMDDVTHVLLTAATLFTTTSKSRVKDRQVAGKSQDHFIHMLYRYLCANIGKSNAITTLPRYQKMLGHLEAMAEIMMAKRLHF